MVALPRSRTAGLSAQGLATHHVPGPGFFIKFSRTMNVWTLNFEFDVAFRPKV